MKAKQIQNCLDTNSNQTISGEKEFTAPQTFSGSVKSIQIRDGYIYWLTNPLLLESEGNTRLSMLNGVFEKEIYTEGRWDILI